MIIIHSDRMKLIFLCDLEPYQIDQIKLTVLASQTCNNKSLNMLWNGRAIGEMQFPEWPDWPALIMGRDELVLLETLMIQAARNEPDEHKVILLGGIIVSLTCALEMCIEAG